MTKAKEKTMSAITGVNPFKVCNNIHDFPSSVTFMGRTISLQHPQDDKFADSGEFDETTFGITIARGMIPAEERDTVLHELIHGIDYLLHLGLTERQVRLLATGIFGMFQENPELAAYITKSLGTNTQATSK